MCSKKKSKTPQPKQDTGRKSHIGQLWTEGPLLAPKVSQVTRHSKLEACAGFGYLQDNCNCSYCCIRLPCSFLFSLHWCCWPLSHIQIAHQIKQTFDPIQFCHFWGYDIPFSIMELNQQRLCKPHFFNVALPAMQTPQYGTKTCHFLNYTVIQFVIACNSNL